jgi:hypothetical protein
MTRTIFFDSEFTGLHQRTSLISLGIVDERDSNFFYAEFTDYKKNQVTPWIRRNVIANLMLSDMHRPTLQGGVLEFGKRDQVMIKGDSSEISTCLLAWLLRYKDVGVEVWSDCLSYDWVLLEGLLADFAGGYPKLPSYMFYLPFDILPLFKEAEIDPDINREEFVADELGLMGMLGRKHNALWDAMVIRTTYTKLRKIIDG